MQETGSNNIVEIDHDFISLALELQEMIISQDHNVLRSFFQVNKTYKYLLEKEYLKQFGDTNITNDEWESVRTLQPYSAILYVKEELYSPPEYLLHMRHTHLYSGSTVMELAYTIEGVSFNFFEEGYRGILNDYIENSHIAASDTLTYYNTNKNRLSCMAIDPCYAKQKCLNDLNEELDKYVTIQDKYDKYKTEGVKDDRFEDEYKNDIIYIYLRLLIDRFSFNIMCGSNVRKLGSMNTDEDLEDIVKDVQEMFNLIINKVENM